MNFIPSISSRHILTVPVHVAQKVELNLNFGGNIKNKQSKYLTYTQLTEHQICSYIKYVSV